MYVCLCMCSHCLPLLCSCVTCLCMCVDGCASIAKWCFWKNVDVCVCMFVLCVFVCRKVASYWFSLSLSLSLSLCLSLSDSHSCDSVYVLVLQRILPRWRSITVAKMKFLLLCCLLVISVRAAKADPGSSVGTQGDPDDTGYQDGRSWWHGLSGWSSVLWMWKFHLLFASRRSLHVDWWWMAMSMLARFWS